MRTGKSCPREQDPTLSDVHDLDFEDETEPEVRVHRPTETSAPVTKIQYVGSTWDSSFWIPPDKLDEIKLVFLETKSVAILPQGIKCYFWCAL